MQSNEEIIKSINNVLYFEDIMDKKIISIYDVGVCLRKLDLDGQYKTLANGYSSSFAQTMTDNYKNTKVMIMGYDLLSDTLEIKFDINYNNYSEFKSIRFTKENGDLIVYSDNTNKQTQIMKYLSDEISYIYDELSILEKNKNTFSDEISTSSSVFKSSIRYNEIKLYYKNVVDLAISYNIENGDIDIITPSLTTQKYLESNKYDFMKNLYVSISDCPEWLQSTLINYRDNQINGIYEEKESNSKQKKLTIFSKLNILKRK